MVVIYSDFLRASIQIGMSREMRLLIIRKSLDRIAFATLTPA